MLLLSIQELKPAGWQDPGDVKAWANETQAKIKEFDAVNAKLKDILLDMNREECCDEEKLLLESKQKISEQENEFERAKFE